MIIFLILLLILVFLSSKPLFKKEFYNDYSSLEQTRNINGIFIMLVLLSHTCAKLPLSGPLDEMYNSLRVFLGQFIVVPFLFYSGYGIMESLTRKENYIKQFPKKRFLTLFIQFSIITLLYIIFHLCLKSEYSPIHIGLSFIGLTSIGNGGWYMFATFAFYLFVIVCFNLFKKSKLLATVCVSVCLVALTVIEIIFEFPTYFYNTQLFFAVGMFYSLFKKTFDKFFMKNNVVWGISLAASVLGFTLFKTMVSKTVLAYPVWCGFGMLMILFITMKIKIQSKSLMWCGKNIFYIFTLQGIPQILLSKLTVRNEIICVAVIISTFLLVVLAEYCFNRIEMFKRNGGKRIERHNEELRHRPL